MHNRTHIGILLVGLVLAASSVLAAEPAREKDSNQKLAEAILRSLDRPGPIKPTHPDVVFATINGKPLKLDLYLPANVSKPVPLVIHIHGGGWRHGEKSIFVFQPYLYDLVKLGFAVASVDYRLTAQAGQWGDASVIFPAQIHDVKGAVRWLRASAEKYHLDPNRFGACGESAGGHLTALLATSGGIAELEGDTGGNTGVSSEIQAGVDYFGPIDLLNYAGDIATPPGCIFPNVDVPDLYFSQLIGYDRPGQGIADIKTHLKDTAAPYPHLRHLLKMLSPITHVRPGLPPLFIGHGTIDTLVPLKQSQRLADAMKEKGNRAELVVAEGGTHFGLGADANHAALLFFCDVLNPEAKAKANELKPAPPVKKQEKKAPAAKPTGAAGAKTSEPPDLSSVSPDLIVPETIDGPPAPGRRVRQRLPKYEGTDVYHVLYLPTDWKPGRRYPVIVEYAGNGGYKNAQCGDACSGLPEGSNLGYGISAGKGFIWVSMPYVDEAQKKNAIIWFGDASSTVEYCLQTVRMICEHWGGDPGAVLLAGFSRGAMACNYIGLHDDRIADVWLAFIPYSFYDGLIEWKDFERGDQASARERLMRLGGRASFVCEEKKLFGTVWTNGTNWTKKHLAETGAAGAFTFANIPFRNHNDAWALRDIPERQQLRDWVADMLRDRPGTHSIRGRVTDAGGRGLAGVRVESGETHWTVTGTDGRYELPGLIDGERCVRTRRLGEQFTPEAANVALNGRDAENIDFTGRK